MLGDSSIEDFAKVFLKFTDIVLAECCFVSLFHGRECIIFMRERDLFFRRVLALTVVRGVVGIRILGVARLPRAECNRLC